LIASILAFFSCGSESSGKSGTTDPPPKRVKVVKALEGKLPKTVAVSGTLAAEEEVVLSMKVQGRIQQIYVDLGSAVKKGQSLLRLEPTDYEIRLQQSEAAYQQARVRLGLTAKAEESESSLDPEQTGVVRQAKAVLEEARLTRERMESLHKEGLIPKSQLDDAQAAYQVADARYQDALEEVRARQGLLLQRSAELELAKKQLSDSNLRSPIDGAVQIRHVSPGQFVAVGDPVLTLVRVNPLRLKLAVPERESGSVRQNQKVQVRVEGDPNAYWGKVARVSPAISTGNRTLMIEAEIPNENGMLRAGSFAKAEIIVEPEHTAVLVPASSVVTFAGLNKVITVENNETNEKRIKVGRRAGDRVEVLEGIKGGEVVVTQPGNLVSGERVTPTW
jgi:RND family efflux transporter MFP subunit